MSLSSINTEQQLYVIDHGSGYTSLGFDVAFEWASEVAQWLRDNKQPCEGPHEALKGSEAGYDEYLEVMAAGSQFNAQSGKRCPALLVQQLVGLEGRRVEVVDRWDETRRFKVGKSMGWLPVHLELANRNSRGGCVVTGAPFKSVRIVR